MKILDRSLINLIIGEGEVGKALYSLFEKHYPCFIQDRNIEKYQNDIDILHICFPYSKNFVGDVKDYQEIYRPHYTVIHSTVPMGTSRKCQAFHSPIRGMHPKLEKGILTFIKYLAPKDNKLKRYFENAGIKIKLVNKPEETEVLKILDTTQYGINILVEKLIYGLCKKNKLDFDIVYTDANKTYNEGYTKLGRKDVIRPVLKHMKGQIGGHCIMQNCDLLKSPLTDFVKKTNKLCDF